MRVAIRAGLLLGILTLALAWPNPAGAQVGTWVSSSGGTGQCDSISKGKSCFLTVSSQTGSTPVLKQEAHCITISVHSSAGTVAPKYCLTSAGSDCNLILESTLSDGQAAARCMDFEYVLMTLTGFTGTVKVSGGGN